MSVFITNGQSFDELAALFTLSPAYGPAIANENNYADRDISGGKFYVTIPDNWLKPEYQGKKITLPKKIESANGGKINLMPIILVGIVGALLLTANQKR